MENIKMNVREEINHAEVMLNWLFDGTDMEGWTTYDVFQDGTLSVYAEDGSVVVVNLESFRKGIDGLVDIEYIGNENYKVIVAKTLDK